jgi:hypothetical protein
MGRYLGKTKHKRIKKKNNNSRRVQHGGKLTSDKLEYILGIIKKYSKRDLGGIKHIVSMDSKKKNKVALAVTDSDIKEVLRMIQTMVPAEIDQYATNLRIEENPPPLSRADSHFEFDATDVDIPYRFGDPTIPDVGATEGYGMHRPSGFRNPPHSPRGKPHSPRRQPRSPRRLPPPPFDTAYLDGIDSGESFSGPWDMSLTNPRYVSPRRSSVRPPAYSHDASVSSMSSPRGHRHGAVAQRRGIVPFERADLIVLPPSASARGRGVRALSPSSPRGLVPFERADSIVLPPFVGVRGRGARSPSPSSPRRASVHIPEPVSPRPMSMGAFPAYHAEEVILPVSPVGLRTIPELPRSINESRKGIVAPPASRDISHLSSPKLSRGSVRSLLSVQDRGRGAAAHSELDMVRYQTDDLDHGSVVAPLSRTHSLAPSEIFNSADYLRNSRGTIVPSAPASALAPGLAPKADSVRRAMSPKAKKKEQRSAWLQGIFDSTAEKVARPDTDEFDFTASVSQLPRPSTTKPMKNIFESDKGDDLRGLFAGPAMAVRSNRDSKSLQRELAAAEQKIVDEDIKNRKIEEAGRRLKARGEEQLRAKREERIAKETAKAALKRQKKETIEARIRADTARIAELEKIKRTPNQQAEFIRIKGRLAFGDDDDDDSSGGGKHRTRRIKKRGHRSHKIKKSRKNRRNGRSGRK